MPPFIIVLWRYYYNLKGGKVKGENMEIKIYNSKERFDYLKQLSREVRELIEEKYPEIYEDEIDFFTKLLELELKHLFLKLGKSK